LELVSLKIKGFKSFADQTEVFFNEDITGIVGPNGCGKSNVVDAMRWVLGEQRTKNLRSEKMDNLIFNGSKGRNPSGRAEVSLTFKNTRNLLPTEFNEVTISRVLYRTGESEYKLNGVNCRLKDIQSLFMDTGVSNDSYAIIELAMINEILADKDNVRRKLIEQAAGVSKFKQRRRETSNKLNATQTDLDRLEDVMAEIESNLKSLEKQAKRTQKLKRVKQQYRDYSIENGRRQSATIKERINETDAKILQADDAILGFNTEITQLEASISSDKKQIVEWEQKLAAKQAEVNGLQEVIRDLESEKSLIEEKLRFTSSSIANNSALLTNNDGLKLELGSKIESLQATKLDTTTKVERLKDNLSTLEEGLSKIKLAHEPLQTSWNEKNEALQQHTNTLTELEKRQAVLKSQLETYQSQLSGFDTQLEKYEQELHEIKEIRKNIASEHALVENKLNETLKKQSLLGYKIEAAQEQLTEIKNKENTKLREVDALKNEYGLLKRFVENMEGYPNSIKYLFEEKGWCKSKPVLLSDVINSKPKYKPAIEHLLSNYLNCIIVKTEAEALNGIKLLKQNGKGRAAFLILDKAVKVAAKDLLPLHEKIETDTKFRALINALLRVGSYGMTNEMEEDGSVIYGDFWASGGSVDAGSGKRLGSLIEMEKLETSIEDLLNKLEEIAETKHANEQVIESLKAELTALDVEDFNSTIKRLEIELAQKDARINTLENLSKNIHSSKERIVGEIEGLTKNLNLSYDEVAQLSEVITKLRNEIVKLDEELRVSQSAISRQSQAFNEHNIEFYQLQNHLNSLQQQLGFNSLRLKELVEQTSKSKDELVQSKGLSDGYKAKISEAEGKLKSEYARIEIEKTALTKLEEHFFEKRQVSVENENKVRGINQSLNSINFKRQSLVEVKRNEGADLRALLDRLSIEFNVKDKELELLNDDFEKLTNGEVLAKQERLQKQIANYGEVNPLAEEAYNEMKERFDFMTEQRDDLIDARTSLEETMQEIESNATKRFLETFDQVKENFSTVFKQLFEEEDECALELTKPLLPLESGIEIIAKPKGKKPSTVNQLSGGEKSLTAISLIFSLYLIKPAPFCILDEVDAPLDDANVVKFNKMIKRFSSDSQFIVVTHNKGTMASVDVIYGVTMRNNISTVVPVDFRALALPNA